MELEQQFLDFPTQESRTVEGRNFLIYEIDCDIAKDYITKNHYAKGCHNGPSPCYGLIEGGELIGVLMFAVPCSENVRASVFGADMKDNVLELHRLHIKDVTPKNTESWFISRCLKLLKIDRPDIKAVLSFSDSTEGHTGIIYQATNAYFIGKTGMTTFYRDAEGRLHHPRQNGVNITKQEAMNRGWVAEKRYSKNRYLYLQAQSKTEKKELLKKCRYDVLHYKWCRGCGKKMKINKTGNLCDACLEYIEQGGLK